MEERKRNMAVGLTAAVGLAGLLVLMLLFGDLPGIFNRTYAVTIELPTAGGLQPGSRVELSGIEIGQVTSVRLRQPPSTGVVVEASIREDVSIPADVTALVETPSLLAGSPIISLRVPADDSTEVFLTRDGSARIEGRVPTIATALAQEMQAVLEEPMGQIERVVQQFESLSGEWRMVGQNLNMIIEPRDVADVQADGEGANLTTIIARTDRRLSELEEVLAGLNRYVNDEALYEDVRQTIASGRALTAQASEQMDKLSGSLDENMTALRRRYVALADDMAGAVGSMQRLVDEARDGEGTMGRMVNDPQLYENLNDAAERMQTAVDEMRLLIQRWRAEGLPIQF